MTTGGGLGIQTQRSEIDGVPVFWAEDTAECTAAIMFRVGFADEPLASLGLTHMVEHLALFKLGRRRFGYNGRVGPSETIFYAQGDEEEVVSFIHDVCASLHALPLDRLEAEKRVLLTEEAGQGVSVIDRLLNFRYGATGPGLGLYGQLGLRRFDEKDVLTWAKRCFTRGNCALWINRPPPSDLRIDLPDGERMPIPALEPIPRVMTPSYIAEGTGGIAASFVGPRSSALGAAFGAAALRAHDLIRRDRGLSYDVTESPIHLTGDTSFRFMGVDCLDEHAPGVLVELLSVLDETAERGPLPLDLEEVTEGYVRFATDDGSVRARLDWATGNELAGAAPITEAQLLAETQAVTVESAAEALRNVMPTMMVIAPADCPATGRFVEYPFKSDDFTGDTELYPPGMTSRWKAGPRLWVGDEGATYVDFERGIQSSVRLENVVAAIDDPPGGLVLIGRNGDVVPMRPADFSGVGRFVAKFRNQLPPDLIVPPADQA